MVNPDGGELASEWAIHETVTPTSRGAALDKLPFFWMSPIGPKSDVVKPPLLGLVSLSLSHYRLSADLLHGAHFTGLPTLYATGLSEQDAPIRVGASAIITIADPAAKVGYAEFTGQGLSTLERMIEATEGRMSAMGAAILAAEARKRPETATAAAIRHGGETSLLSGAVSAVQATLQAALEFAAQWMRATGSVTVELNSDFISKHMDGPTLTALTAAYQAGALTLSAFLQALADGDVIPQAAVAAGEAGKLRAVPQEAAA